MLRKLKTHDRYAYSPIHQRKDYRWTDGKRLAVYIGLNLEHFEFGQGLGARLAPSGDPDVLNYSWRDYGNRVAVWRLLEVFDALRLPVGVILNTSIYDHCPEVVAAFRARGDEIIGHGHTNAERPGDMTLEEERQLILNCTARLRSIEGRAPAGWLSPWISESASTPDLLKEAGYAYTLNWCHDDQPTQINTRFGPLVSLPYPQEINDIPAVVARLAGSSEFADMIVDCFDEMLEQSQAQPLVMGIALHPYIVGQPHRLRHLRRALTQIVSRQQAWITHPGQIVQAAYPSEPGSPETTLRHHRPV
jgi:peptidoglycan/xylan/chitin deacetylase (PgdA/CDA1 family)